jgi:16S rRNA C967 or C1407 C5-methylase (RsmB/RsmF family)
MEAYYKEQKIIAPEKWEDFLAAARANLPTTFRISPVVAFAEEMKSKIKSHFEDLKIDELAKEMKDDDERLKAPEPIAWYPDNLAWGMSISKKALKKTPALEKFHKYIVAETETGNITRQEAVSMIPPLFMDVEPHHRVLDMCAAPGSKTSQCLEFLHAQCGATGVPTGVVIANDADLDRCSMLTHQMKRINSPSLVVLHHEAQNIPMLWQKSGEGASLKRTPMRYDRVLADVPCRYEELYSKKKYVNY